MTQLERLIARLVQLVEDSPCQTITLTIQVDNKRVPVTWQVTQTFGIEGLDKTALQNTSSK